MLTLNKNKQTNKHIHTYIHANILNITPAIHTCICTSLQYYVFIRINIFTFDYVPVTQNNVSDCLKYISDLNVSIIVWINIKRLRKKSLVWFLGFQRWLSLQTTLSTIPDYRWMTVSYYFALYYFNLQIGCFSSPANPKPRLALVKASPCHWKARTQ